MINSLVFIAFLTVIICLSLTLKNAGEGGIENRSNIFLKGLCAVLIMLHHAVSIFDTTYLWFFKFTGYVTTAIFFGLSGYGLTVQLQQGKYRDIVLFQKKRLKTILIPFSLACVIYLCVYKVLGVAIDVKSWFNVGQLNILVR